MKEAVFEVLERVNSIKNVDARTSALQEAVTKFPRLKDILYYGLSNNVKFDLPEGQPPYKELDEINSHHILWTEIRRLYLFVEGVKNLTPNRRQELFISVLEVLHPRDASLVLAIKDRKWPYDKITVKMVDLLFPGLLNQIVGEGGARRDA